MTEYFELLDDLYIEGRWYLNGLVDDADTELDAHDFTYGHPIDVGPPLRASLWNDDKVIDVQLPLRVLLDPKRIGMPLDFTYSNDNMPVVTTTVAEVLGTVAGADIQRIPVQVESQWAGYEIINVISCVD